MSAVQGPEDGYADRNAFLYLVLGLVSLSQNVLRQASDLAAPPETEVEGEDRVDDLLR